MSAASAPVRPSSRAPALPLGTRPAYAAELLGTFLLVTFIVFAVSGTAPTPAGTGNFDIVLIALTHGIRAVCDRARARPRVGRATSTRR